jgi:phage protein U
MRYAENDKNNRKLERKRDIPHKISKKSDRRRRGVQWLGEKSGFITLGCAFGRVTNWFGRLCQMSKLSASELKN